MTIYLYVKQHAITGLKYFGMTTSKNPYTYKGSGTYWKNHIKKHGTDFVETIEVWEFSEQSTATKFAINFSTDNNIVESTEWANQILENALPSPLALITKGVPKSEEHKKKMSDAKKGKKFSDEHKQKLGDARRGKKRSKACVDKLRQSYIDGPRSIVGTCPHCGFTGKIHSLRVWHMDRCKKFISHDTEQLLFAEHSDC